MDNILYINQNNFATILNKASNLSEIINELCVDSLAEGKVATEMIIREQHNKATLEEARKNIEVISVGMEVAKNRFGAFYNESLISDEEFQKNCKKIGENLREYFTDDGKFHSILESYNASCLNENLRYENVLNFTKAELDRIKGVGKYDGSSFGDYEIGKGGLKEVELDCSILQKLSNCDIKDQAGNYIFREFLICDGNGTALKCHNYGFLEAGIIKNFGGMVKDNPVDAMKNHLDFREFGRKKIGKGNAAKLRFLSRVSGMKEMDEQNKQYTDQITRPAHYIKSAHSGLGKGASALTSFGASMYNSKQGIALFNKYSEMDKLQKLLKDNSLSDKARQEILKKLAQTQKDINNIKELLAKRKLKVNKFKSSADLVWNPHKAVGVGAKKLGGVVSKKIVSTKAFNNTKNSVVVNGVRGVYDKLSVPFKTLGKYKNTIIRGASNLVFNNSLSKMLQRIFTWTVRAVKIVALPVVLIIIIVLTSGLLGEAGQSSTTSIAIMPLADKKDFENYQNWYNSFDDSFLKSLENYVHNKTTGTNLKGEHIYYGINGMNNEDGMKNNDYSNGLYYKYITDSEHEGRSSNIEDLIAMMAIIMGQQQSQFKEESKDVLKWLYNISHTYTYQESPLFACNTACHKIDYHCYDHFHHYEDSDIRYNPFHAVSKSGDDYEIKKATNKCEVCSQFFDNTKEIPEYTGGGNSDDCVIVNSDTKTPEECYGCVTHGDCFHGSINDVGEYVLGRTHSGCTNPDPVWKCVHECDDEDCDHDCSDNPIGCGGYYVCLGHPHYSCDGHEYKCCLGHLDIQMNIKLKFYEEIKDIVNKYDFGDNDFLAKELNND